MTWNDVAVWLLYSTASQVILGMFAAATLATEFLYMRAHRKHNDFIEAMYIDKDDPHPDMTLDLMRTEAFRLREVISYRVKWFYWSIGFVMVYALLVTAASHYLR